ncbi:MAG: META domain-containing protein [Herbiconiux sp.]|nr:META domain-containing protein [Herbiconiux sp.]
MSSRSLVTALALTFGLVALTGCASGGQGASSGGGAGETDASPVGVWRAEAPDEAWLEIADDGSVSGSDGCNAVTGSADVTGAEVTFTMGLSTLIACPDVSITFSGLRSASVSGDVLTTRDAAGAEIVALRRDPS